MCWKMVVRLLLALLVVALQGGSAWAGAPNLVLISLDTTRADALSCYGGLPGLLGDPGQVTPTLDALAAGGVRFERFYSHAPTTLNSHTSMMTGLDPHQHQVPRNGFALPEGVRTLAERLSAVGYDSHAVVGAKALAADMGLSRGFRTYDDTAPTRLAVMYQDLADGVRTRAVRALEQRDPDKPLFLFVHFYDPHQPFVPPVRHRERLVDPSYDGPWKDAGFRLGPLREALVAGTADPASVDHVARLYLAEVAFVDEQIGLLMRDLHTRGLLDHALVVVTADHGEVLSEVPLFSYAHGTDVSEGVMRVPLILRGFGVPVARGGVVRSQAALSGLAPTLEQALGLPVTLGARASFWHLAGPGPVWDEDGWPARPTRPVALEATRPHSTDTRRWNNLGLIRGLRAGGAAIEVFPGSLRDQVLLKGHPGLRETLLDALSAWDAAAPPFRAEEQDEATREALRALGYVE